MKNLMTQWVLILGLALTLGAVGCTGGGGGNGDGDAVVDAGGDGIICTEDAECDDDNPCTSDACVAGACELTPTENTCDDGDLCTVDDMCVEGECVGMTKACDDGVYCNGAESCNANTGTCEDGAAPEIDDGVDCTLDGCDEDDDKVVHVPNDDNCDDGNPCTANVCESTLGCQTAILDGETCEDGSLCTTGDTCDGDSCVGAPVECDDGEFCNGVETCDPDNGECSDGEAPELDDGLDCTLDECDEDNDAVTHGPEDGLCDDGNTCTVDTCDLEQGCVYDTLDDGDACDDDNECTDDDVCGDGTCLPGKFICVEDCANNEDDDQDDLVDCDDDDCALNMACQPGGDLCGEAFDLTLGVPLTAADAGAVIQFFGTTIGKTNVFSGSCDADTAAAADTVHKVELAQALGLQISADFDGGAWAALYILNEACTEDLFCAANDSSSATMLTVVLQPGTYFITVDGAYPGDVGTYGLEVEVFLPSNTEIDCGDGVDNDADGMIDCDDDECADAEVCNILTGETCGDALLLTEAPLTLAAAGTEIVLTGTTAGMMDDVVGSCNGDLANSPDLIYSFELLNPLVVDVSFDFSGNKWPALYVFGGDCLAENELGCMTAKSDAATFHQALPAGLYFLVLDASYSNDAGPFTLTVSFDAVPATEVDCINGIDDDLNGATDCDDEACGEDPLCVGFDGDNCAKPFAINEGLPVTAALYGQTLTYQGNTEGLQDFYSACAPGAAGSPDAVYMLEVQDPVVIHATHDFAGSFWPAFYAMGADCDAGLLLGCDTATSGAAELDLALPAGVYFFVIDASYVGDAGPFTFELDFAAPPSSETICYDGTDNDVDGAVDCADDDCAADLYCLDLYEPNDTQETAYDLGDLSNMGFESEAATVSPAAMDVDHFKFSILGDHALSLSLTPSGGLDGKVTILDANGVTLFSADTGGINIAETISADLDGPATYFVWVSGYGITTGYYDLSLTLTALTEYDCTNGGDEDGDDLVDCCDDDCAAAPGCGFEDWCVDGADNDCDGLVDCDDEDCMGTAGCGAGDTCEDVLVVNDGVALDGTYDGVTLEYWGTTVGYANDFTGSCDTDTATTADAVWELTVAETVAVNVGMDFQGFYYPAVYITDAPCGGGAELVCAKATSGFAWTGDILLSAGTYYIVADASYAGDEAVYQLLIDVKAVYATEIDCGDGVDNDYDGLVDCCDDDCGADAACATESECADGLDNDCDGLWDCGDTDCGLVPECEGEGCAAAAALNEGNPIKQADAGLHIVVVGDTSEAKNDHAGSCDADTAVAKDLVYTFEVAEAIGVAISHDFDTSYLYPAVYLYGGDCMMESELACAATTSVPAAIPLMLLQPGTYYVVVDSSFPSDAGAFTLTLDFSMAAETETDCLDGIDNDLNGLTDCADPTCAADVGCLGEVCETAFELTGGAAITAADSGLQIVAQGDTSGATPDLTGSCDSDTATANDLVYTFTLDEAMAVKVDYDFDDSYYWPAVYVFAGACTAENEIGCAATSSDPAVIDYAVYEAGTYFIVVDASYGSDAAAYTLAVSFMAPVDTETSCSDGLDNDLDGFVDCCDDECTGDAACLAETTCGDDVDNDCDGVADCADSDCAADAACAGESCAAPYKLNGGAAVVAGDLPLQLVETGDTSAADADVEGSCDSDTEAAKDRVYELVLETEANVTITHDFDSGSLWPAVYVFAGECITDNELACNAQTSAPAVINALALEAGTYYIVVDSSYPSDAGLYTLTVDIAGPVTAEDNCQDGVDNDDDGFADCEDDDCGPEICGPEALPWSEDFSYLPGADVKGGIYGTDAFCGWEITGDPLTLNGFAQFDFAAGCSATDAYWIVGALLDVQACAEISVTFDEAADFATWAFSHQLAIFDGFAPQQNIELPLDALTSAWSASGPHLFDVSAQDFVRIGAGYIGDDADTWRVDNFVVECTSATEICDDGDDNDGDELADCADPDCLGFSGCLGDNCAAPLPLTDGPVALADAGLQVVLTGDTTDATSEYEGSCDVDTASSPEHVYVFELTEPLLVSVSHDFDGTYYYAAAYLFGGSCEAASELACDVGNSGAAEFGLTLDAGTYYIIVDASYSGDAGPYSLIVDFLAPPPADEIGLCDDGQDNDLDGVADCVDDDCASDAACAGASCDNPIPLAMAPIGLGDAGTEIVVTGDTSLFSNEHIGSCSADSEFAKDVAYVFELSETMMVAGTHDFDGTSNWSAAYLFAGSCSSAFELGCDTGNSGAAALVGVLPAGTYFIIVDANWDTDAGPYTLTVTFDTPPPTNEVGLCTDGEDNDLDELIDCLDVDDCGTDPGCGDDDNDGVPNSLDVCPLGDDAVDADVDDIPDACEIDWAGQAFPNVGTEVDDADAIDVYVQVYMDGVTNAAGQGMNIEVDLVVYTDAMLEAVVAPMAYNVDVDNNDEYKATIPADITPAGEIVDVEIHVYYVPAEGLRYEYNEGDVADQNDDFPLYYVITGQGGDLPNPIISEYVEGSSNNMAVEIVNLGPGSLDLTTCGINFYFNESPEIGTSYILTDDVNLTLGVGDVWVICHPSFDAAWVDTYCNFTTPGVTFFNGDDVVELVCDGVVQDILGKFAENPGIDFWGTGEVTTQNHTLRRKCSVTDGDTDGTDVFDPAVEWDGFAQNTFDNLGLNHCL
ncbi:MAG: hypothetical protein ABIK09_14880 [Pseudomonadota bacterium]